MISLAVMERVVDLLLGDLQLEDQVDEARRLGVKGEIDGLAGAERGGGGAAMARGKGEH